MKNSVLLLLLIALFTGCEKDKDIIEPPQITVVLATLRTNPATDISKNSAVLGGNILDLGNTEFSNRGVCWSLNTNPTIEDDFVLADGSGLGLFNVNVSSFSPETTYNVRAFVQNEAGIAYGNNINFTTESINIPPPEAVIEAFIPKKIITSRAELSAIVNDVQGNVRDKGFVLATFENPTLNDIVVFDEDYGIGQYVVTAKNLNPNTVYYGRPYVRINGTPQYGNQVTFKTTGYFGPAGGYVVYDHGELVDGWRYMEASPQTLRNKWGCDGTFITGTLPEIGSGKSNTSLIINRCSQSDCAARRCDNYVFGGFSDWFLPSTDELEATILSLVDINVLEDYNDYWTSTQTSATRAYTVSPRSSGGEVFISPEDKGYSFLAIPIRRY